MSKSDNESNISKENTQEVSSSQKFSKNTSGYKITYLPSNTSNTAISKTTVPKTTRPKGAMTISEFRKKNRLFFNNGRNRNNFMNRNNIMNENVMNENIMNVNIANILNNQESLNNQRQPSLQSSQSSQSSESSQSTQSSQNIQRQPTFDTTESTQNTQNTQRLQNVQRRLFQSNSYIQTPNSQQNIKFDPFSTPPLINKNQNNNESDVGEINYTQFSGDNNEINVLNDNNEENDNNQNNDNEQQFNFSDVSSIESISFDYGNDGGDGSNDNSGVYTINQVHINSIDDDEITKRLNEVRTKIKTIIEVDDTVKGFYSFMNVVGKCYSYILDYQNIGESILINDDETVTMDDVGTLTKVTNFLNNIPLPNSPSSYKSRDMYDLSNVIPVSDITTIRNSPMFYCILSDDCLVTKQGFISYVNQTIIGNKRYIITKYTDRPTIRYVLYDIYENINKNMINFALFVLENLHMIKVNKKYILRDGRLIIFDLYSFINNVFAHYSINNNLLDYHTILNVSQKKDLNTLNHPIYDMGLKIGNYTVSDDSTICYVYWLYMFKYINFRIPDISWIRNSITIKTTKDLAVVSLANYQINKRTDYGSNNIANIDSNYTLSFDIRESASNFNYYNYFEYDLEIFYKKRSDEEKNSINNYFKYILDGYHPNEEDELRLTLFMIYPLIYKSINQKNDYIERFKNYIKQSIDDDDISFDGILLFLRQIIPEGAPEIKKDIQKCLYKEEKITKRVKEKYYGKKKMEIENKYTPEPIKKRIPETVIKKDSSVGINKMVEEKNNNVYKPEKIKKRKPEVYYGKKKMEEENKNVYKPEKLHKKFKEFKKIEVIEVTENTNVNDMSEDTNVNNLCEDYSIEGIESDNGDTLTKSNNQPVPGIPALYDEYKKNEELKNEKLKNQNSNNQNSNREIRDINDISTQDLDALLSNLLEDSQHHD